MANASKRCLSEAEDSPRKALKKITTSTPQDTAKADDDSTITSKTPACRAVFETPELLENILICLPEYKIIAITGVCHLFKNTVQQSPKLQQKLFLAADPAADSRKPRFNDVFCMTTRPNSYTAIPANPQTQSALQRLIGGMMFLPQRNVRRVRIMLPRNIYFRTGDGVQVNWDSCLSSNEMFLTQPPLEAVHIAVGTEHYFVDLIKREGGVKFKDVHSFVERYGKRFKKNHGIQDQYWLEVCFDSEGYAVMDPLAVEKVYPRLP